VRHNEKREDLYDRAMEMLLSESEQLKPRGRHEDGTRYEWSLSELFRTGRGTIRR
jgi:hypothetical protein